MFVMKKQERFLMEAALVAVDWLARNAFNPLAVGRGWKSQLPLFLGLPAASNMILVVTK